MDISSKKERFLENIVFYLYDFKDRETLFKNTEKALTFKRRNTDESEYIKIQNFCSSNNTIKEVRKYL